MERFCSIERPSPVCSHIHGVGYSDIGDRCRIQLFAKFQDGLCLMRIGGVVRHEHPNTWVALRDYARDCCASQPGAVSRWDDHSCCLIFGVQLAVLPRDGGLLGYLVSQSLRERQLIDNAFRGADPMWLSNSGIDRKVCVREEYADPDPDRIRGVALLEPRGCMRWEHAGTRRGQQLATGVGCTELDLRGRIDVCRGVAIARS